MSSQELIERKDSYLRMMERVPTQGYITAALVSIGLSAVLRVFGAHNWSIFVGQWPPTFLLLALVHKLLQPSGEPGFDEAEMAASEAGRMVSSSRQT